MLRRSWHLVNWEAFAGPRHYRALDVPLALDAVITADSRESSVAAYNRLLFAVGNNHAGTLYAAAEAVVAFLLGALSDPNPWTRETAANVLDDVLRFEVDAESYSVEEQARLGAAIRREVASGRAIFEAMATNPSERPESRRIANEILELLSEPSEP